MGLLFLKKPAKKVKLSLFGMGQADPQTILNPAFEQLEGVKLTRFDRKRNIAEVILDGRSPVTGDQLLQTILSAGLAAEVL